MGVEFNVSAQNVRDRAVLEKLDQPNCALMVGVGVVDQKAARDEEIPRQDERGAVVVEDQVAGLMSGRREDVDDSPAEVDVCDALRPLREAEEVANRCEIRRDELDAGQALELAIAGAMIEMLVGVDDQERELRAT